MRNFLSINLFILAVLLFVFAATTASAQDDVIRVDTDLVAVPVSVLDQSGRYIDGLGQKDFKIFENGVEQPIDFFGTSDQPITVLMLLDRSGSMQPHLHTLAAAATSFVAKLRPTDQIVIASFADTVDEIIDLRKKAELPSVIKIRPVYGDFGTLVYDSVDYAFRKLKKIKGRKAIVIFSDGISGERFVSRKNSLKAADETDSLVYTVRFGLPANGKITGSPRTSSKRAEELIKIATEYMTSLADKTGGRSFQIDKVADLESKFGEIAAELSRQYTLGYYPSRTGTSGERRKLKVEVSVPNAVVRARSEVVYKLKN